jgi:hypothetical protein
MQAVLSLNFPVPRISLPVHTATHREDNVQDEEVCCLWHGGPQDGQGLLRLLQPGGNLIQEGANNEAAKEDHNQLHPITKQTSNGNSGSSGSSGSSSSIRQCW